MIFAMKFTSQKRKEKFISDMFQVFKR